MDAELAAAEAAQAQTNPAWYQDGLSYWEALPATVSTVLGGYERVSPGDIKSSDAFLLSVFPAAGAREAAAEAGTRTRRAAPPVAADGARLVAADLGAGVGRVTEHLLQRRFDEVDTIEPVAHYLATARERLGPGGEAANPACTVRFVCEPLQAWTPEAARYDVVWVQWCMGHLTDADFVPFLRRCVVGLKPGGLIIVKENNCAEGVVLDKADSSLTRSNDTFLALFEKAELDVRKVALQRGFPSELFAVRMYALAPRARVELC